MDRDLILAGLIITGTGVTLIAAGQRWTSPDVHPSARTAERKAWRSVWGPLAPSLIVAALFVGWAIVEPAQSDEHLPSSVVASAMLFIALWIRAAVRAALAVAHRVPDVAGTVGLWRPRVVISDKLLARVDGDALNAVLAHEAAHARHRDPLRICLAQVITDLQWPFPSSRRRFDQWRHVLELARDEEVRAGGVDGADLAAAILVAAQLLTRKPQGATLIHARVGLETRITRLLAPLPPSGTEAVSTRAVFLLIPVSGIALLCGVQFGEPIVQGLAKWLP